MFRKTFAHAEGLINIIGLRKDKDVVEKIVERVIQNLFEALDSQERSDNFQRISRLALSAKAGSKGEKREMVQDLAGDKLKLQEKQALGNNLEKKLDFAIEEDGLLREKSATIANKAIRRDKL